MRRLLTGTTLILAAMVSRPAWAEPDASTDAPVGHPPTDTVEIEDLQQQLVAARHALEEQRQIFDAQEKRLLALEDALLDKMRATGIGPTEWGGALPAPGLSAAIRIAQAQPPEAVGVRPAEPRSVQEVAVLPDRGSVLTKAGRLTLETSVEYTRADRNRFVFRGVEVPQSVLVGVFDINESRQNIITAAASARFGLADRLEIGLKVPWVYRDDGFVLVPLVQNPGQAGSGSIDRSTKGSGLGDLEITARYLLTGRSGGSPILIANLQAIAPTGKGAFDLPRDGLGNATRSATGFGFWGISPSVTMLVPTDPATLFAVAGYNFNFGKDVNTRINDAQIDRVDPGSGPNATLGIGIALNERTSISFAYAHNWVMSTRSRIRPITVQNGVPTVGEPIEAVTRDLQVGRLLFGISHRLTSRTALNFSFEFGATEDAPDLRMSLRIPILFK